MTTIKPEPVVEEEMTKAEVMTEEFVPGTVRLFDAEKKIRKIPVPSNDPNDPLNFSDIRRYLIFFALAVYGVAGFGVIQSTPLFFPEIIPDYMKQTRGTFDVSKIGNLASYPSLCMGIGNFLFVPLSMAIGRRPIFLLNNALMLGSTIWAAKSGSFDSHLGARCLQGLTAGLSDCLLPIIILDITFLHRRGLWMALYWSITSIGSNLLLVAVPFVVQHASGNWRMNYWFWVAFSSFSSLVAIFFLPETLFYRPPALLDGRVVVTDAYGQVRFFDDVDTAVRAGFDPERPDYPAVASDLKPSYSKQLSPLGKFSKDSPRNFFHAYAEMAICFITPGVFWALLVNAVLFAGLVAISLTYAQILEEPPWSFGNATVGTAQLGSAIGAAVSLLVTGASVDWTASALTKRNGGIREPEFLLPNFILPGISAFLGLVIYGVVGGHPEKYSWVGVHASFALYQFGFISISTVTGVWLGEVSSHWAGAAIVLVCGGRNAASFGITHSFPTWIAKEGFQNTHITLAGIFAGLCLLGVPLFFVNRRLRKIWFKHLGSVLE